MRLGSWRRGAKGYRPAPSNVCCPPHGGDHEGFGTYTVDNPVALGAGLNLQVGKGGTDLIFNQQAGSSIRGESGVVIFNDGAGITSVTVAGDIRTTPHGGNEQDGLNVKAGPDSSGMTLHQTGGTMEGGLNGIFATTQGSGDMDVTISGNVIGRNDNGVYVAHLGATSGNIVFNQTAGTIAGDETGINVQNSGVGAVSITTAGNVTTSAAASYGMLALNAGSTSTDVSVRQLGGAITSNGLVGIAAWNDGTGSTTVSLSGNVTATAAGGYAVQAYNNLATTQDVTVEQLAGELSAESVAIHAMNLGSGTTTVSVNATAKSVSGAAIQTTTPNGVTINIGANAVVSSSAGPAIRDGAFSSEPTDSYGGNAIVNSAGTETGNWYLRSELQSVPPEPEPDPEPEKPLYQAGVSSYETYPQALLGLNGLPTLQQRVGNRAWADDESRNAAQGSGTPVASGMASAAAAAVDGNDGWMRIEGGHKRIEPRFSTSDTQYKQDMFRLQGGIERILDEDADSVVTGGIAAHCVQGRAKTESPHGGGWIDTRGFGITGTLSWYTDDNVYLDGQGQVTWYRSDLSSAVAGDLVDDNDGLGYALSLEGGRRIPLDSTWFLTPQAQLVYSHVKFDDFSDVFDARVDADRGSSLQGRLGVAVDHQNSSLNSAGLQDRRHIYGIANLYYEFIGQGTRVDVAGTGFDSSNDRTWGGLGIGGTRDWDSGKYALYGEILAATSLNNFGDSYSYQGQVGFRMKW